MVRSDCELMCNNCLKYNTEDTVFHGIALKMLKEVERVIQVKRNCATLSTGLLIISWISPDKPLFLPEHREIINSSNIRAIKFLKRDNYDMMKINEILEIGQDSNNESDYESANNSSSASPR